jgi:hypothetical protein
MGKRRNNMAYSIDPIAQALGELLAVIHRDGGQYQQQHGVLEALDNAKEEVYRLRAENATLKAKVERIKAIATWMDTVPISNDWDVLCQAIRKLYAVLRGEGE